MNVFPPPSGPPTDEPSQFVPVVSSPHPHGHGRWLKLPLWSWIAVGALTLGGIAFVAGRSDSEPRTPAAGGVDDVTTVAPETTTAAPTTTVAVTSTVAPTTVAPTTVAPTTVAPTTLPPTTLAPTTVPFVAEYDPNDRLLSDFEYQVYVDVMHDTGFEPIDRAAAASLGLAACDLAAISATDDEFIGYISTAIPPGMDPYEGAYHMGALTGAMCYDEVVRLGF